ncbi:MAG: RDD family protein [Candidatus Hatepunaea meridiana]|nr:RDD family protein [Candidatus Hatepunaea meridiana]
MNCPSCEKEVAPDSVLCSWCNVFIPVPEKGKKAGFFARFIALLIDPLIAVILVFIGTGIIGGIFSIISDKLGAIMGITAAVVLPILYLIWFLTLLKEGVTPGKRILGLHVVNYQTGENPGLGKMILREIVGRIISMLFLSLGYWWALFDKNSQAWHDKLAGTIVLKAEK